MLRPSHTILRATILRPALCATLLAAGLASPAMATAPEALNIPPPYLWLNLKPAALVRQSASVAAFFVAERIRISCTSRQPRLGLAWRINAMAPEASGAAEDVPPNVEV